ncbi:MAG: hydroxymethylglutaryl-CoA lyase [Meiothermus sp.]|nr:hydroxymethylglutaryl-CoA lyase [Meiothermus sp.]
MKIQIVEVGARDGLQNETRVLEPAVRAELVNRLIGAGLGRLEAVSFVNPARVPQMAGAEEVLGLIRPRGAEVAGLVLNEKGYERAAAAGVRDIRYSFPASDAFARRNQNSTVSESLELAARLIGRARVDGRRLGVVLGTAFGCPFEGEIPARRVIALGERLLELQPGELILADTIGVGVPGQVRELLGALSNPVVPLGLHLHNTRNTGYANALAGVESGAVILDSSVGGIGGCPFAPKATGNIATEDLVYLLHRSGYATGIDLEQLLEVSVWLSEVLAKPLPGLVYKAGGFPPAG